MKLAILSVFILSCLNIPGYSQWVQTAGTPQGRGITDMLVTSNGTIVVTCASYNFPSGQFGGIRHSTNNGDTWQSDYLHYTARTLAAGQNGYLFASSWNYPSTFEGLYVSTNQGADWTGYRYLIGPSNNIFSILVRENNQTVFIGTRAGVLKSTNGGFNFTQVNNGIPLNSWVRDIEADSSGLLAAATTNGLFISTNNAASWQQAAGIAPGDTVVKLAFNYNTQPEVSGKDRTLLAGTIEGNLYESNDYLCTTYYVEQIFGTSEISDIEIEYPGKEGPKIITVISAQNNSQSSGCNVSTNNGNSWQQFNNGLPQIITLTAVAYGSLTAGILTFFLGSDLNANDGARIYKWLKTIGIQTISNEIPNEYLLSQNYPNPFNPMTKIKFDIKKVSNVSITVFDVLGRHITTLVNEKLNAGSYETEWNANNMPGGVYFYKLETEDFSETKKMILVK